MIFVASIGRSFGYDAPGFVDAFLDKEKAVKNMVGEMLYHSDLWDYRQMILTGFWSLEGERVVESVTPLWTEEVGRYYSNLGYPFQDPSKRFLKTLYWYIVREYTVNKAPLNKGHGKCQHPNCPNPSNRRLNVHHGSVSGESYMSLEKGFQPIVGREHLHDGMLTVLCETCHAMVTEQSWMDKMTRSRSLTVSSKDNTELFKQIMSNLVGNKIVNKRDVEPSSVMTIGDMVKYKQEQKDKRQ
jgi:hypothetical protein